MCLQNLKFYASTVGEQADRGEAEVESLINWSDFDGNDQIDYKVELFSTHLHHCNFIIQIVHSN